MIKVLVNNDSKIFETRIDALTWLNDNASKITNVTLVEQVLLEKTPPDMENWVLKNKKKFVDEYGKEKGMKILYATAWKKHKNV